MIWGNYISSDLDTPESEIPFVLIPGFVFLFKIHISIIMFICGAKFRFAAGSAVWASNCAHEITHDIQ